MRFFIWLYYNRFRTSVLTAESCLYIQPTGTISENYKCSHVWLIIKRLARNTIARLTLYTIRTRRIFRLFTRFIRVLCYLASLCCNRKQKKRKKEILRGSVGKTIRNRLRGSCYQTPLAKVLL